MGIYHLYRNPVNVMSAILPKENRGSQAVTLPFIRLIAE